MYGVTIIIGHFSCKYILHGKLFPKVINLLRGSLRVCVKLHPYGLIASSWKKDEQAVFGRTVILQYEQ